MNEQKPLRQRKQLQAREKIICAANELFRERGFEAVSITDIADRAEVGRTSFFRYFGDKQEVIFAHEQALVEAIGVLYLQDPLLAPATLAGAITQLREIVVALCVQVTADPEEYERHYALIDGHPDLQARDAVKLQRLARLLAEILVARGAGTEMATLASQAALACFQTARYSSGQDPRTLVADTEAAFDQLLQLGSREERQV